MEEEFLEKLINVDEDDDLEDDSFEDEGDDSAGDEDDIDIDGRRFLICQLVKTQSKAEN